MTVERLQFHGELRQYLWRGDLPTELTADPEALTAFLDGRLMVNLRDELLLEQHLNTNLVTNLGAQQWTSRIITGTTTQPGWIALGSGTITPQKIWTVTDWTGAATEFFRKALSIVQVFQTYYMRYVMNSLTTDWNGTCRAAGLFDASGANSGNMFAVVSENVVKSAQTALTSEWRIQIVN